MFRSSTAMRAAAKRPPYSASATKEQTTGMRVEWVEMGWLMGSSARKVIAELPM
jgi:hypothetical protein